MTPKLSSKTTSIMLRYRPIAPKPSLPRPPLYTSGAIYPATTGKPNKPRTSSGRCRRRSSKKSSPVTTLPLLPDKPVINEDSSACPATVSWVTVESVTETWSFGGADDVAVMGALEVDACPAFVSDEVDTVTWTNGAFRKMVGGDVAVRLVTRGMVPAGSRAFTCRVHVRYGKVSSMAAPCDVWRMMDGRWAWRVDVKAALSLSL